MQFILNGPSMHVAHNEAGRPEKITEKSPLFCFWLIQGQQHMSGRATVGVVTAELNRRWRIKQKIHKYMLLEALSKSYCTLLHSAAHTRTHTTATQSDGDTQVEAVCCTQTNTCAESAQTQHMHERSANTIAKRLLLKIWDVFFSSLQ